MRARAFGTAAETVEEGAEKNSSYFFAEEGVSWKSLGISDRLCRALSNASLYKPSLVQVRLASCLASFASVYSVGLPFNCSTERPLEKIGFNLSFDGYPWEV